MTRPFLDTNVLIYAFAAGEQIKTPIAQRLLAAGGVISVQTLNEVTLALRRKQGRSWVDVRSALFVIRDCCEPPLPLLVSMHERALAIAEHHQIRIYDAMIVSAALAGGCDVLFSEDLQDGRVFEEQLTVHDPFKAAQTS